MPCWCGCNWHLSTLMDTMMSSSNHFPASSMLIMRPEIRGIAGISEVSCMCKVDLLYLNFRLLQVGSLEEPGARLCPTPPVDLATFSALSFHQKDKVSQIVVIPLNMLVNSSFFNSSQYLAHAQAPFFLKQHSTHPVMFWDNSWPLSFDPCSFHHNIFHMH